MHVSTDVAISSGYGSFMPGDLDLARLGALLGDRSRAAILMTLLAGRPMSASALAEAASISPSLASNHLRKLVDGGLLVVEPSGRQRLFRLGNAVGDAIEGLLLLAPPDAVHSLRAAIQGANLRQARMCYDHIAGRVGVAITDALLQRGVLAEHTEGYSVTERTAAALHPLGVDISNLTAERRPLTRRCMDWSERRSHLAGSLGAAMTARMIALRWIRVPEASRVVRLTADGHAGLYEWLQLELAASVDERPTSTHGPRSRSQAMQTFDDGD